MDALRDQHAEVDDAIESFCEALVLGYFVAEPERVPGHNPPIFAHKADYPPFGPRGRGRFRVTFMLKKGANPMREPDVFWLLTIKIASEHLS